MFDMSRTTPAGVVTRFSVLADPDPGTMARVLELFAKRGLTPRRFSGQIEDTPEPKLELEIEACGLAQDLEMHIARSMAQIFGVDAVSHARLGT
jgi:acetolactate synthase small subunit